MNAEWRARYDADGAPSERQPTTRREQVAAGLPLDQGAHRRRPGLTPGYRLVLGPIAKELDMSVVPVREAIRQLEAEGLVTFERNVGAQVVDGRRDRSTCYTHADARASSRARRPRCRAPRSPPTTSARARAINERMIETLDALRPARVHRAEPGVPRGAVRGVRQPAHARPRAPRSGTGSGICATRPSASCPAARQESVAEHESILELIEAGADPLEIELAARRHRTATLDAYLIHEHPDEALGLPDLLDPLEETP